MERIYFVTLNIEDDGMNYPYHDLISVPHDTEETEVALRVIAELGCEDGPNDLEYDEDSNAYWIHEYTKLASISSVKLVPQHEAEFLKQLWGWEP